MQISALDNSHYLLSKTHVNIFKARLEQVAVLSAFERRRLLSWIIAYTGLSAAWYYEDKTFDLARTDLAIARLALEQFNS